MTFLSGASFTGEEVVELHLHGSQAIVSAVLRELDNFPELSAAGPGDFTRRALENGCLDLAQVEGLADLIDSETESQRKQALRVFSGALGEKAETWRRKLIRAASLIEATIDFVDEDVPVDVFPEVKALLSEVQEELVTESSGTKIAERIRDGFEVAILGAPNVGKSTLLNALAGREAAITSDIAGTTRDVIEVKMDLNGLAVTFLDTAGLRLAGDEIEKIGIDRARRRADLADLRIYLLLPDQDIDFELSSEDLVVWAKNDVYEAPGLSISAKSGSGLENLISQISTILSSKASGAGLAIRERHSKSIIDANMSLCEVQEMLNQDHCLPDIVAELLRHSIRSIDAIVGRVDVEDLLDEIFTSFCIGK